MDKLILTASICGAEVTKKHNPAVPYTVAEIAAEARRAAEAGAAVIHLHVRWDDGTPTQDAGRFRECIAAIRAVAPDVIVQVSTGGAVGMSDDERLAPVALLPEMATIDCGSVNFGGGEVFLNSEDTILHFAERIYAAGVKPELEVFDKGMVDGVKRLAKKGLIQSPMHFNFVMGTPWGISGEPRDLLYLAESLPENATFTATGIGRFEMPMANLSILLGGHVRVGFEDNVYLERGVLAPSNGALVEKAAAMAKLLGRPIASPNEARKILHMPERI